MKTVITYGTFDLFHQGHYNILKRAKEAGDYLIVGVTGESFDLERGKINVRDSLITRIENVRKTGLADRIIVEEYQGQKVDDILKYNVDIFIVGSDWIGKFDYLKDYCEVKYLTRTKNISSTQLRQKEELYNIGIVSDTLEDGGITYESKFVSGIHIDAVYCEDKLIAKNISDKYEINKYFDNYHDFLKDVDIVYIKLSLEDRFLYSKIALENSKYVIVDSPITLESENLIQLFQIASEHHVLVVENIISAYLRAFNQLIWLLNGNLIGKIVGADAYIACDDFSHGKKMPDILVFPLFFILKIFKENYVRIRTDSISLKSEKVYMRSQIKYEDAIVNIAVGNEIGIESKFIVYGEKGHVVINNDWWNTGYFEAWIKGEKNKKRYCFNFEGDGFRYLLQEMLIMIREKRSECTRIFRRDSLSIVNMLEEINK